MPLDEDIRNDEKFKLETSALLKGKLTIGEKVRAYNTLYEWCINFGLEYRQGRYNRKDGPDLDLMSRLTRVILGREPLKYVKILAKDYERL